VIAGVLILLTIYSLKPPQSLERRRQRIANYVFLIVLITVIIPFSISAIMVLNHTCPGLDVNFTTFGFGYLIAGIIAIVVSPRLPIPDETFTGKVGVKVEMEATTIPAIMANLQFIINHLIGHCSSQVVKTAAAMLMVTTY
jgi:hypothetical protein